MALRIDPAAVRSAAPVDSLDGRALTLVLHGFGADELDLLPIAPALGTEPAMSLRAPVRYGPGWSWAPVDPAGPVRGAGLDESADAVLAWLDEVSAGPLGRPDSVRLLGFSQGGATALQLLRHAPERFAAVVLLSGFVSPGAHEGDAALAALRPPVFWGRGDADAVIPAEAVDRTAEWLAGHAAVTERVYPGLAHGIDAGELADVAAFLAAH
ncbi:alpha/beta hydrolase [uncultured Amnibacterium sp.]|uniref:alpha/beta hydrolase n=1 Tax=uncultured Amnibacterium sp. TaxID=1631851 RepID=UPI0035C9F667